MGKNWVVPEGGKSRGNGLSRGESMGAELESRAGGNRADGGEQSPGRHGPEYRAGMAGRQEKTELLLGSKNRQAKTH